MNLLDREILALGSLTWIKCYNLIRQVFMDIQEQTQIALPLGIGNEMEDEACMQHINGAI